MAPRFIDAAAVRVWAWRLEGRADQVEIARRAAERCVDVWETVPESSLRSILPLLGLGDPANAIARPRAVLRDGADLQIHAEALLGLQHVLAFPDGHGPHYYEHGPSWFGRYRVEFPPYELDESGAPAWLWALSSCTHALATTLWRPAWILVSDEIERDAEVAAGPIRATVEACVASFVARSTEQLDDFVGAVFDS